MIKEKIFNKAKDQAIGVLAKMLEFQASNINVQETLNIWLNYLPIFNNKMEGLTQHRLLV